MSLRTYRTFQAFILGCVGLFLLFKVSDGQILLYINRRFVILVLLAGMGMLFLSQVVLRARPAVGAEAREPGGDQRAADPVYRPTWNLWLLALPLLFGLLIPQRPLSASVIPNRGVNVGAGDLAAGAAAAAIPDVERTVLDWVRLSGQHVLINGEQADVTGFVYHDRRLGESYFLVGRFTIVCCVADAVAYGMAAAWPEAQTLPDNVWVRVVGPVSQIELDGRATPVIQAVQVEIIPEPLQPYLFP